MEMHQVELTDIARQCTAHRRRPIKSSECWARKVSDENAVHVDWDINRYRTVSRPVHVGREHFDPMPYRHQCPAKAMDSKNRSTISDRWQITRNNMEDAHSVEAMV